MADTLFPPAPAPKRKRPAKAPMPGVPRTFTLHGPQGDVTGTIGEFVAWVNAHAGATPGTQWKGILEWYRAGVERQEAKR